MDPHTAVQVEMPQYLAVALFKYIRANRDDIESFMNEQDVILFGDEAVDTLEFELCDAAEVEWTEPE